MKNEVRAAVQSGCNRTSSVAQQAGISAEEASKMLMLLRREGVVRHNQRLGWRIRENDK